MKSVLGLYAGFASFMSDWTKTPSVNNVKSVYGKDVTLKDDMKYYRDPRTGQVRKRDCSKCRKLIGLKA